MQNFCLPRNSSKLFAKGVGEKEKVRKHFPPSITFSTKSAVSLPPGRFGSQSNKTCLAQILDSNKIRFMTACGAKWGKNFKNI